MRVITPNAQYNNSSHNVGISVSITSRSLEKKNRPVGFDRNRKEVYVKHHTIKHDAVLLTQAHSLSAFKEQRKVTKWLYAKKTDIENFY